MRSATCSWVRLHLIHEAFVAEANFNGVEVFLLQVLQQGEFQELLVVYLADVCGDIFRGRRV